MWKTLVVVGRVLLVLFALFLASATVARCQSRPPVSRLLLSREAAHFVDSLAIEARETRRENAGCAVAYAVRDSLLIIERFAPAQYDSTDSIHIFSHGPICPVGVPSVHSHVADGGYGVNMAPSDTDRQTSATLGFWALLLVVMGNGYFVGVY